MEQVRDNLAQMLWCYWMAYNYPDDRWHEADGKVPGLITAIRGEMLERANQILSLDEILIKALFAWIKESIEVKKGRIDTQILNSGISSELEKRKQVKIGLDLALEIVDRVEQKLRGNTT